MTVAALTPTISYVEDGVTTAFAVPFRYDAATDLIATRTLADGTIAELAYGTAWAATPGATDAGGTLTLVTPPLAGAKLTIDRATVRSQTAHYETGDRFPAETHERVVDRTVMMVQEVDAAAARSPRVPKGQTAPALDLTGIGEGDLLVYSGGQLQPLDLAPLAGRYWKGSSTTGLPVPADPDVPPIGLPYVIFRNYLDDIPGVVEGSLGDPVANAAAIAATLAAGGHYYMRPGGLYKIGRAIDLPSNSGILCDSGNPAIMLMDAAGFNNSSQLFADRYGDRSVGLRVQGQLAGPYTPVSDVVIENFILQSEELDGRLLSGIAVRNVDGLDINGVEMFGFPLATGIRISSALNSAIRQLYAHDFYSDHAWGVGAAPNIEAIRLDDDLVNGVGSDGLLIDTPRIRRMLCGPTFFASSGGYQTDAIVNGHTSGATNGTRIVAPDISDVGEGIDDRCQYGSVIGGTITDCYYNAIKAIHGAKRNTYTGVTLSRCGTFAIVFAGSPISTDTAYNSAINCNIDAIDPDGTFVASQTACVGFIDNVGTTGKPRHNLVLGGVHDTGQNGKMLWLDDSTGADNDGRDVKGVVGPAATRRSLITNGAGSYVEMGQSYGCQIRGPGTQALADNTATALALSQEDYDTGDGLGGYMHTSGPNPERITPAKRGLIKLRALVTFASNSTGMRKAQLYKNGVALPGTLAVVAAVNGDVTTVQTSGSDYSTSLTDYYEVRATQTSGGALNADLAASRFELHFVEAR